jgi:hypothetical protein
MGISFNINEDSYKSYIASGIEANPAVHDQQSAAKIWRYAQRAHFHASAIASIAMGLVLLILMTDMKARFKKLAAILIGLSGLYALSWYTMYMLAPTIGRGPAHDHLLTEIFAYSGIGGLVAGFFMLVGNMFFGLFTETGKDNG